MTAREVARICDDAPASVFAPDPVSPYRRGFEDAQERAWFCPWPSGTAQARQYRAGWDDAKAQQQEVMQ